MCKAKKKRRGALKLTVLKLTALKLTVLKLTVLTLTDRKLTWNMLVLTGGDCSSIVF